MSLDSSTRSGETSELSTIAIPEARCQSRQTRRVLLQLDADMPQAADDGLAKASKLVELAALERDAARVDLLDQIFEIVADELFSHRDELLADLVERADLERIQRRDGGIELGHRYERAILT